MGSPPPCCPVLDELYAQVRSGLEVAVQADGQLWDATSACGGCGDAVSPVSTMAGVWTDMEYSATVPLEAHLR